MTIKVQELHENATFKKAHASDTGYDLTACDYEYKRNGLWHIKLGIAVEPKEGTYFELVPRSSFSKTPFLFANNIGIIDSSFRGEWCFPVRSLLFPYFVEKFEDNEIIIAGCLANLERNKTILQLSGFIEKYLIGKRIAQAIPRNKVDCGDVEFVDELSKTERGTNGFGSTGE